METKHFFYKLIPPRPEFHLDQNEDENNIMKQHATYWSELTEHKLVLVYGPVLDPAGVFGMGVLELENQDQADEIAKKDPAVSSGVCKYEIYPMMVAKKST